MLSNELSEAVGAGQRLVHALLGLHNPIRHRMRRPYHTGRRALTHVRLGGGVVRLFVLLVGGWNLGYGSCVLELWMT